MAMTMMLPSPQAAALDWLYSVRPGDNMWSISERLLLEQRYWWPLVRYNNLRDPDAVTPGGVVRIPVDWLRVRPAEAQLVAVVGEASLIEPGGQPEPATVGALIKGGETLRTGADGGATVRFADASEITIGPNAEISFDRLSSFGTTGMIDSMVRLSGGRMRATIKPGSGFGVTTPSAVGAVRGTEFRVSAEPETTLAEGLAGQLAISAQGVTRLLPRGRGTLVRDGQAPQATRALLPAPRLEGPTRLEQVPQRLRLMPIPGSARYRVELATDPEFRQQVVSRLQLEPNLGFDVTDGRYWFRARGVDPDGIEGMDLTGELVVDARPEPPLPLLPRRGGIERGDPPRFAWASIDGTSGYRIQIARDEGFTALVADERTSLATLDLDPARLPPGSYHWRVAAIDGTDQGPFGPPSGFERRLPSLTPAAEPEFGNERLMLRWPPMEPRQKRQIQVADDRAFTTPLDDVTTEAAEVDLRRPWTGRWLIRNRVIEEDGSIGPWSPVQAIEVPLDSWWPAIIPFLFLLLPLL